MNEIASIDLICSSNLFEQNLMYYKNNTCKFKIQIKNLSISI